MINFAWPWAFLLLPLPWILRLLLPASHKNYQRAIKIPFFNSLNKLNQQTRQRLPLFSLRHILAYIIWLLLILALSGPQIVGRPIALNRSGHNILMAIDLSGSMSLPDFNLGGKQSTRLDVVKKVAGQFISARLGDRIGLILFGSKAYMRTPLTFDLTSVKQALMDASIGLAGQQTAIGDAIGLAVKRLKHYPAKSRVLILLTDGASNTGSISPANAAELAKQYHIKIYTIGIGADRLVVNTPFGPQLYNPSSDLDEHSLKMIAHTTDGQFFRAKNTQALEEVYQQIDKLEPITSKSHIFRPTRPLYPWPLGLALLLSLTLAVPKIQWRNKNLREVKS